MSSDVKWIKLSTQMFEDEKIRLIESMPEGDAYLVCWFKLFLTSSKNRSLRLKNFSNGMYSNEQLLSILLKRDILFIKRMIAALTEVGVMEIEDDAIKTKRFWLTNQEVRSTAEYKEWRTNVFERDNYTCQICKQVGGSLQAHHIKPFAKYKELRFDVSNGQTLCESCHKQIHKEVLTNG